MNNSINTITEFSGEYYFLSNFFPAPVTYVGYTFQNSEAAFHSAKCPARMAEFCPLSPSEAKHLGRHIQLRTDWETVKDSIMYEVCKAKFTQNPELAKLLIDTGDSELIEGNTWGDKVWGVCNGEGENRLGKILMKIRDEIRCEHITGETSDGYHTFNELYHHRAILFSVICNSNPDIAWKSKLHDTGTMFDGMFIVGVDTPYGQATYHYDIDPYWDMFNVKELDRAPKWDGHTPSEAIERIRELSPRTFCSGEWIPVPSSDLATGKAYKCSVCNRMRYGSHLPHYCSNCGTTMGRMVLK